MISGFPAASQIKTLQDWTDIHQYQKPGWIFRGQRSVMGKEGQLKTSLERCCEREDIQGLGCSTLERNIIREFKRAYHQYGQHPPVEESLIEWISIMQHHGAPTRLLDFTYSLYVAAYFALEFASEKADDACAVWAIRAPWASKQSAQAFEIMKKEQTEKLLEPTESSHEPAYRALFFEPPFVKVTAPISPFRLTERLRIQKGIFMAPGDLSVGFIDNLTALSRHDSDENVIQIILPRKLRTVALEKLHYMNISRTSLFPGLDGYAQSLGVFHPSFRPDPYGG